MDRTRTPDNQFTQSVFGFAQMQSQNQRWDLEMDCRLHQYESGQREDLGITGSCNQSCR